MNLLFWEGVINGGDKITAGEVVSSSSSVKEGGGSLDVVSRLSTLSPESAKSSIEEDFNLKSFTDFEMTSTGIAKESVPRIATNCFSEDDQESP